MRGSRTRAIGAGALALAGGLLAALAAGAAGFTLARPGTATNTTSTSSTTSTTSTQGFSTAAATNAIAASTLTIDQVNFALAAMAAGAKTLGGPGAFLAGPSGETRIYELQSDLAPNVCATVRNLSAGEIRVSPSAGSSIDVLAFETRSVCVLNSVAIVLTCRQGTLCEAIWRIDRF